jgi:hypothetical protein
MDGWVRAEWGAEALSHAGSRHSQACTTLPIVQSSGVDRSGLQ